jgi:hypothetical protein
MGLCAGVPVLVLCIAGSLRCVPVVSVFQDLVAVIVYSLSRKFGIFLDCEGFGIFLDCEGLEIYLFIYLFFPDVW